MRLALRFTLAVGLTALALPALAQETTIDTKRLPVKEGHFEFEGPFGTYDRAALQRGFQVYKEVCAACHGLNHIAFHNLDEEGGPGFTEAQAKAIAAGYKIPADPNDKGEITDDKGNRLTRPGILADKFGGKRVFTILTLLTSIPLFILPFAGSYNVILTLAFFVGLAGVSFAIGNSWIAFWVLSLE